MENNNSENRILGILIKSIPSIAAVFALVIGVYASTTQPIMRLEAQNELLKKDIDTIKNNELVHLKDSIDEIKIIVDNHLAADVETQKKLERILTILERNY